MVRGGGDVRPGLENAAAIAAPTTCVRFMRARRARIPRNGMRARPFSSNPVAVESIVPASRSARTDLLGATRPLTRSERGAFAARGRRASLQLPTTGRRTTTIERIIDWPARVAVVERVAPVSSPQAAIDVPLPCLAAERRGLRAGEPCRIGAR